MSISRRTFLQRVGWATAGGAGLAAGEQPARASGVRPVADSWMGVLVDLTQCNGCRQCEAACQKSAGFAAATAEGLQDRSVFREHRRPGPQSYTTVNEFSGPPNGGEARAVYVKANCLHCNDPACASACLVGALRKQPNGAVTYEAWKCMGCRYCMVACPFQIPTYEYDNVFTPQVRKCTFCVDAAHPERAVVPACVQACPKECLTYGKRSDLLARARARIAEHPDVFVDHVYGEHEAGGTSWLYLSGVPFENLGFLKVSAEAPPRLSETIQHGVFKHFVPPVVWVTALGIAMWMTRTEAVHTAPPNPPDA